MNTKSLKKRQCEEEQLLQLCCSTLLWQTGQLQIERDPRGCSAASVSRGTGAIAQKKCVFFFKKLNVLYLKLFSGKIYLVFGGFEKAECSLTLGCLCPCSNESDYSSRKPGRAPEPHCPQPGVPACTNPGCSKMSECWHFGYRSDHLSNSE